jgi:sporulation protein YlmC with PRC-barrel domain
MLKNLTVLTADGQAIGTVASLQIQVADWRIAALDVKVHRGAEQALGVRRQLLRGATVTIPTGWIQSVQDALILGTTTAELRHRLSDSAEAVH